MMASNLPNGKIEIRIKHEAFSRLVERGTTLFFFHRGEKTEWNGHGYEKVTSWVPMNTTIETTFSGENDLIHLNDTAWYYGQRTGTPQIENGMETVVCEPFDDGNFSHVKAVLLHHLSNSCTVDRYACKELVWYLYNYRFRADLLEKSLQEFNEQTVRPFLLEELKRYAVCLPFPKQRMIQYFLERLGITYEIYYPKSLKEAVNMMFPGYYPESQAHDSVFSLVCSVVVEDHKENIAYIDLSSQNEFIQMRRWLYDECYALPEISLVTRMLRLFSPRVQRMLLRRYFLAVYKKQTNFDIEVIKQFRD